MRANTGRGVGFDRMRLVLVAISFAVLSACWRGGEPPPAVPVSEPMRPLQATPETVVHGMCTGGGWGDVEIETLSVDDRDGSIAVHGVLSFVQRRTELTMHGPRGGVIKGSMTEIEGLGTKWKLALELSVGATVHGQLFEIVSGGERHDMCTFDLVPTRELPRTH